MPYKDKSDYIKQYKRYYQEHKAEKSAYTKKYRAEHKEEFDQYSALYRKEHSEEIGKYQTQHYQEHKVEKKEYWKQRYQECAKQIKERNHKWKINNRDKVSAESRKRRAIIANTISNLTAEQAEEIKKNGCFFCGSHDHLVIAHDIPVIKRGNTNRANVFCLCEPCNLKMYTKRLVDVIKQLRFF